MAIKSFVSATTQIMLLSRFVDEQISQGFCSEILKQISQYLIVLFASKSVEQNRFYLHEVEIEKKSSRCVQNQSKYWHTC